MQQSYLILASLFVAACATAEPAPAPPAEGAQLVRGGQEARLRCGSETLRAKLQQGELLVQVGSGEQAVLVPKSDPRARPGEAYGDGKLTLYRPVDADRWRLARSASPAPGAECRPDTAP